MRAQAEPEVARAKRGRELGFWVSRRHRSSVLGLREASSWG